MNTATYIALAAVFAVPGAALAQTAVDAPAPSAGVRYADLNLSDPRDVQVMLVRIRQAAAEVCHLAPGAADNDSASILQAQACYRQSVKRAVAALDAPRVTAAYDAKPGRTMLAQGR